MKLVFLGTPEYVVPVLEELAKKHEVVGVFCQPDKKGNRNKIQIPPVKNFALSHKIPVFQPEVLDEYCEKIIKNLKPDAMVVAAFGKLIPQKIIDIAPILNIHPSDLPKYRGSSPTQWALISGEKQVGVSIMKICKKMDAGDILKKGFIEVKEHHNAKNLLEESFVLGIKLLLEVLENLTFYLDNATKQNESEATLFPMLKKQDGQIDFSKDAAKIVNLVKGLYMWPVAFCFLNGKNFKIFEAEETNFDGKGACGEVVLLSKRGITVACGRGFLLLKEVQIENGKRMPASAFINGNNIKVGDVLC